MSRIRKNRARRPRSDAQHAAVVAAGRSFGPPHPRCRLRNRRVRHRGRAPRRTTSSRSTSRPSSSSSRRAVRRRNLEQDAVDFRVGDMLDPALGRFDHVVAMDSLIHYTAADIVKALERLAARTRTASCSPTRPRHRLLALMHAIGRAFPRTDRAPAIEPVSDGNLKSILANETGLMRLADRIAQRGSPTGSIHRRPWSSFAHEADQRQTGARLGASEPEPVAVCRCGDGRAAAWDGCCAFRCSRSRSAWRWCC